MGHGTTVVLASNNQLNKTIGSLTGVGASHNGAPVATTTTSAAANNVLGSGPAVSVSSSAQLVSLLGNAAPGSGGTINVAPGPVNTGARVGGAVSAKAGSTSVNVGANVSLGGK